HASGEVVGRAERGLVAEPLADLVRLRPAAVLEDLLETDDVGVELPDPGAEEGQPLLPGAGPVPDVEGEGAEAVHPREVPEAGRRIQGRQRSRNLDNKPIGGSRMKLSHAAFALSLAALSAPLAGGCSSSMDPKECMKLREDSFDLINKAQHCNTD